MITWTKKTVCVFFCGLLVSVSVFAMNIKGNIFVNGGFSLGTLNPSLGVIDNTLFMGGRIQADYAINQYLSVGLETGFNSAQIGDSDFSIGVVPILARIAWHPFSLEKLDPYLVGKAGYGVGFWTNEGNDYNWSDPCGGFVWGVNLGTRFFFTKNIGCFVEAGYECQCFEWDHPGMEIGKWEDSANGRTYITIGIALKFGN
ncbi:porin family protein [Brucepastera parasyntrophica]|uniref:outer membrane beta-barrel protein n=1 Tax=Brucepastera parasyntrophica TaxID=2880008 RepID=UPI0021088E88|nr:outer membrane beta-barrel protein [Brucepastera parasyntrophica]ULQ58647.1 porin family protein [Brucepastera parasyntrophica]